MKLSVGIVGLPNAGKSTLFNALASRRLAETAPRPFTTIDPHEAVVPVPDENLEKLKSVISLPREVGHQPASPAGGSLVIPKVVPATVTFIDIAGLVKGAHKGEGLGNQFLAKIREVDAIVHVVDAFTDADETRVKDAIEIINLELELGGIKNIPMIYVLNVGESSLQSTDYSLQNKIESVIQICAKLEEEFIDLSQEERGEYLEALGIKESGLEKFIKKAYELLGLITFYTIKGGKEISAWALPKGESALAAAERVHTDFAKGFIKAEVIEVDELLVAGSWKVAKEKGQVRLEGKDYIVKNRDVIEFKVGS